jgi:hypothetical protein
VFLDIINRPVFNLKYSISETGFCLRLQVKAIVNAQKDNHCSMTGFISFINWLQYRALWRRVRFEKRIKKYAPFYRAGNPILTGRHLQPDESSPKPVSYFWKVHFSNE